VAALTEPERYASRFAGKFLVEGRSEPLLVYEVFSSIHHPRMRNAPVFARAIALYQQAQIEEALAMLQSIVHLPLDGESIRNVNNKSSDGGDVASDARSESSGSSSSIDEENIDGVVRLYIESCTQILRAGGSKRLPSNWQSVLSVTKGGRVLFDTNSLVRV
jgi:hypothetical protein